MHNKLLINRIWYSRHETDRQVPDHTGLQRREGAEDFRRTNTVDLVSTCPALSASGKGKTSRTRPGLDLPRTAENGIAHHNELGNYTQDIQMGAMREEKVPQQEHFRQRRGAGAEGEDGGESVELGVHALGEQVVGELGVDEGEAPVDESETLVHAIHGAAHVAGAFARQEAVEGDEGFGFAARGVQEGRAEHVHPLHVDARFSNAGFGPFGCGGGWAGFLRDGRHGLELG